MTPAFASHLAKEAAARGQVKFGGGDDTFGD